MSSESDPETLVLRSGTLWVLSFDLCTRCYFTCLPPDKLSSALVVVLTFSKRCVWASNDHTLICRHGYEPLQVNDVFRCHQKYE